MGQTLGPIQIDPSGPHRVHFSAVKEVVEIESGRFEFFKQMLTIGLGGVAGLAAIFTEPDKVPEDLLQRGLISLFAICAIVSVVAAASGISTYANHLRDVEKETNDPTDQDLIDNRKGSAKSIITHAQVTLVAMAVGALALTVFAGIKLFEPRPIGAEAALKAAERIVSLQPGKPIPRSLDHFQTNGAEYEITYVTEPNQVKYTVRVSRTTNEILEISPKP